MVKLTDEIREQRARAADEAAQERVGAAAHDVGTQAPGFVHYGDLRYVPGELLPAEVAAALAAQQPEPDHLGVYRLAIPTAPQAKRKGDGS